jgi:hypothetical protein
MAISRSLRRFMDVLHPGIRDAYRYITNRNIHSQARQVPDRKHHWYGSREEKKKRKPSGY